MVHLEKKSEHVKAIATELGFQGCGIAQAAFLEQEAATLENWLLKGYQGQMRYMENHFDKRLDPRLLVPGARTVISLLYSYFPEKSLLDQHQPYKLAKYAYGEDYHFVIKDKLKTFFSRLKESFGEIDGRVFVDSAPVMERQWAQRSGLGWLGKNSLLLNKKMGSFFFLAEVICDLELQPDLPAAKNHCGTCTRCIDACPTDAIVGDGVVAADRCISYLTIELKEAIPNSFSGLMENWVFGCDICQDVCPWNRFSVPHQEPRFRPNEALENLDGATWRELTEETFRKVFKKSPVKRTKLSGIHRNIAFLEENKKED
ncbi:MAG: tRNA epoxyqueuosine(34) reductase QueG [Nitritalea sp.]